MTAWFPFILLGAAGLFALEAIAAAVLAFAWAAAVAVGWVWARIRGGRM
jgi:hypothetical protein